jgi:triosephosphate isomerase (TIM)
MRRSLVVANWKMNGSETVNQVLLEGLLPQLQDVTAEVVVCPPFVYLSQVDELLDHSDVTLGAQNCALEVSGAFTGEVSATMLRDVGVSYVIVGHSERRALFGESDQLVAAKVAAVKAEHLTPILCVGETLEERESNRVFEVIAGQLQAVASMLGAEGFKNIVVAYEPVWAIGTGLTASPAQAEEVHAMIREFVKDASGSEVADSLTILYGGSVNAGNAEALFAQQNIDGALVGGASLKADDFANICKSVR